MVVQGLLEQDVVDAYDAPFYAPSAREIEEEVSKECPFSREVWDRILSWANLSSFRGSYGSESLYDWWRNLRSRYSKHSRRSFDGLMFYFWWSVWLERNNKIFHSQHRSAEQVALVVKELVGCFSASLANRSAQ